MSNNLQHTLDADVGDPVLSAVHGMAPMSRDTVDSRLAAKRAAHLHAGRPLVWRLDRKTRNRHASHNGIDYVITPIQAVTPVKAPPGLDQIEPKPGPKAQGNGQGKGNN